MAPPRRRNGPINYGNGGIYQPGDQPGSPSGSNYGGRVVEAPSGRSRGRQGSPSAGGRSNSRVPNYSGGGRPTRLPNQMTPAERYAQHNASYDYGSVPTSGPTADWIARYRAAGQNRAEGPAAYQDALEAMGGPSYVDPYNGLTADQILLGVDGAPADYGPGGGGGGGGVGGGGGGAGGSADPYNWAGIAALQAYQTQTGARDAAYQKLLEDSLSGLGASYQGQYGALDSETAAAQAAFDRQQADLEGLYGRRQGELDQARMGAEQRYGEILGGLEKGLGQTRQNVSQSYGQTDQKLAQLEAEYAARNAATAQGANQTLGAFGVAPSVQADRGASDVLMASRGLNTQLGGIQDAGLAGRSQVYQGLGSDVRTNNQQQYSTLSARLGDQRTQNLSQLAIKRQEAQAAANRQRAELAMAQAEQERMLRQQFAQQQAEWQAADAAQQFDFSTWNLR